ncbi:hypothetical protein XF_2620 [Xylella fastidiosa 9a5c]|uniref:Uncharacterized protein n=1 Tax=Xylella fastidiosa (strain 9a5c) TaxID=160492 RepID=Q9PA98_XYLFA|nr:hypothetical protein XF_2620 [Xylella fastidiosa 9a5c]
MRDWQAWSYWCSIQSVVKWCWRDYYVVIEAILRVGCVEYAQPSLIGMRQYHKVFSTNDVSDSYVATAF